MNKGTKTLYHGSPIVLEKPEYGKEKIHNDYGLGFYCTEELELAKEWAVTKDRDGYANKYELDLDGLKILNLSKDATILHWITLLLQNRVFSLKNSISKVGKEYLVNHYSLPIENYDVVIGYRADDSYFTSAQAFLNNMVSIEKLSKALRLGDLGEQVVLISKKAFKQIHFVGYEVAESKIYYPKRELRNELARKEYFSNIDGKINLNETFLSDIIKEGNKNDASI